MARFIILLWLCVIPGAGAFWTFTEINYSPDNDIYDSGISWRPQGGYALIVYNGYYSDGLIRYDYPADTLTAQAYPNKYLDRIEWAPDGSYALISGSTHLYRYEHAATGFGAMTEITSIDTSGATEVKFYDIVWNPSNPTAPPYIATNRKISASQHQIVMYRYDPLATPYQVYKDYSGGTTYAATSEYGPVSIAFQADGDYIAMINKIANGYSECLFIYDPDQSTFPTQGGAMRYFQRTGQIGNGCAVTMSPVSGKKFILLKGNGEVQRATQTGVPASIVWDVPGSPSMTNYAGDADYSYDGARAIVVEREVWSPYHRISTFDQNGNQAGGIDLLDLTQQRTIRLNAVAWHPYLPIGLIGGEDGWLIRFYCSDVSIPTTTPIPTNTLAPMPTATPTPSATSTPRPVPTQNAVGIICLLLLLTGLFCMERLLPAGKI